MPFISTEQAALLNASSVRIATLAEFQFRAATTYLWNGAGVLDVAGFEWQGLNGWGGIDQLPNLHGTESDLITVTMSGVDPANIALAKNSVDDVEGRYAYFWLQLFDADWQPVGTRIPAWWGTMQRIVIERSGDGEAGGSIRTVGLEIENPYAARGQSAAGRYTDSDQEYRYSGDKFCRFVSDQALNALVWPDY